MRTHDGTVQIAWPSAIILHRGHFVGFTMPRIDLAHAWLLQRLVKPTQRHRFGIPERMQLRLYAGLNLASVLQSLHDIGHYAVDLKPKNVFVYRDDVGRSASHVALVDCDGFQVRGPDGARYDAELATPEFLHPDAAAQARDGASFDLRRINDKAEEQDNFALAIVLFQLLNNGLHPMQGRVTGTVEVPTDDATRLLGRGRFYAYGPTPNPAIMPDEESLHTWFDPMLRDLFDRAFLGRTAPPRPRDWVKMLRLLASPDHQCTKDLNHWMLGTVCGQCGWPNQSKPVAPSKPVRAALPARPPPPQPVKSNNLVQLNVSFWITLGVVGKAVWAVLLTVIRMTALLIFSLPVHWKKNLSVLGVVALLVWVGLPKFRVSFPTISQESRIKMFVEEFFATCSENGWFAVQRCSSFYPGQAFYYGVLRSHGEILERKNQFMELWPKRIFSVRDGTVDVFCETTVCHAAAVVDWITQDSQKCQNGMSKYEIDVYTSGNSFVIVKEGSEPVRRPKLC